MNIRSRAPRPRPCPRCRGRQPTQSIPVRARGKNPPAPVQCHSGPSSTLRGWCQQEHLHSPVPIPSHPIPGCSSLRGRLSPQHLGRQRRGSQHSAAARDTPEQHAGIAAQQSTPREGQRGRQTWVGRGAGLGVDPSRFQTRMKHVRASARLVSGGALQRSWLLSPRPGPRWTPSLPALLLATSRGRSPLWAASSRAQPPANTRPRAGPAPTQDPGEPRWADADGGCHGGAATRGDATEARPVRFSREMFGGTANGGETVPRRLSLSASHQTRRGGSP